MLTLSRAAGLCACLISATMAVSAQRVTGPAPAQGPANCVVTGTVVDASTGKGVPNVSVSIGGLQAFVDGSNFFVVGGPGLPSAITNGDGKFVLRPLAKGTYRVSVNAPGYLSSGYGVQRSGGVPRDLEVSDPSTPAVITIKIWRSSSIGGTVVDENGEPMVGVSVRAFRQTWSGGRPRYNVSTAGQTDDRGVYRLSSLNAGDYIVAVAVSVTNVPTTTVDAFQQASAAGNATMSVALNQIGAPFAGGVRIGDQHLQLTGPRGARLAASLESGPILSYQTTYFPGTTSLSTATVVTLAPGETREGSDIRLRPVRTVRVSGTAQGPRFPVKSITVRMVPADATDVGNDAGLEAAVTQTDGEGRFVFLAVPAGQYVLKMQDSPDVRDWDGSPMFPDPTLWASQPVHVGDEGVTSLAVAVRLGSSVSGRLEFEAGGTPFPPERLASIGILLTPMRGGPGFSPTQVYPGPNLQFQTPAYAPGFYTMFVPLPAPWQVKSATIGAREVSTDALELGAEDIKDLVVTITDQVTEVSGTARDGAAPALEAAVYIFPADVQQWIAGGMSASRARSAAVNKAGNFTARLPSGDYIAVALAADVPVDLQNPNWIKKLESIGTRLSLKTGDKKRVDLQLSQVR